MKMRKLLATLMIALLVAGLFVGCGAASKNDAAGMDYPVEAPEAAPDYDYNYGLNGSVADSAGGNANRVDSGDQSSSADGTVTPQNQKLIRTVYMDAETEDMDALLSQIEARINELGGYVEAREIYNGSMYASTRYRHANLTIRIPASKLDLFVENVAEVSNITSNREDTDDVTLQYVAIESRIAALETEQARLLELLAKAEDMNDLLTIEARLTDVRYELENISSQLRVYDNKVNYGTIYLDVNEVVEYTEPEPENGWQRMLSGFVKSLKGVGNGLKEFFIWLVSAIPYLVLIGGIGFGIFMIIWCSVRRKRRKNAAKKAEE